MFEIEILNPYEAAVFILTEQWCERSASQSYFSVNYSQVMFFNVRSSSLRTLLNCKAVILNVVAKKL